MTSDGYSRGVLCRHRGKGLLWLCSILVAGAIAIGCRAPDPSAPVSNLNLLLVTLDTTRSDRLSAYGYRRDTTPNLERLVREGIRFEQAYSPTSSTGPTHATLFTGLYPIAHGVIKNGMALAETTPTLAEHLGDRGYLTAAVVSSFVLDARFGMDRGFGVYDDDFSIEGASVKSALEWEGYDVRAFDRRADATTDRALRWLREERDPDTPFFLFVHYFDPHIPYDPPEPHRSRYAVEDPDSPELVAGLTKDQLLGLHDGEIRFVDAELGRLLNELRVLGLAEETVVVVTADHGEGLMDHGILTHGLQLYEEAVRVPLVIWAPARLAAGRVIPGPVELIDLPATVLDLIGADPSAISTQGQSLVGAIRGEEILPADRSIHLHRVPLEAGWRGTVTKILVKGELFAIRHGRWKYIAGSEVRGQELFDLEADPDERRNVVALHPEIAADLAARIERWKQTQGGSAAATIDRSEEALEGLRALGYVD